MLSLSCDTSVCSQTDANLMVTPEYIFGISPHDVRISTKKPRHNYNVKQFVFFKVSDKHGLHYLINCKISTRGLKHDEEISLVTVLADMSTSRLTTSLERLNNMICYFDNCGNSYSHKQISIYLDRIRILVSNELTRKQKYVVTPPKPTQTEMSVSV